MYASLRTCTYTQTYTYTPAHTYTHTHTLFTSGSGGKNNQWSWKGSLCLYLEQINPFSAQLFDTAPCAIQIEYCLTIIAAHGRFNISADSRAISLTNEHSTERLCFREQLGAMLIYPGYTDRLVQVSKQSALQQFLLNSWLIYEVL